MRVTIVGHGPSIEKAELGDFIDGTDGYVIRISRSYAFHSSLHHGDRADYVCSSIRAAPCILKGPKPLYETWLYFPSMVTISRKAYVEEIRAEGFNPVICCEEIDPWLLRYKKLNTEWRKTYIKKGDRKTYSFFSIGMSAIIIAIQRIKHIDELLLVGFDNLVKGCRDNFISLSKKGKPATSGHNYAIERQLLDEVVNESGVKLLIK